MSKNQGPPRWESTKQLRHSRLFDLSDPKGIGGSRKKVNRFFTNQYLCDV